MIKRFRSDDIFEVSGNPH